MNGQKKMRKTDKHGQTERRTEKDEIDRQTDGQYLYSVGKD
jgi:hypothetical protein